MADKITIICRNPGMRRAGIKHPASATYPAGRWSEEQIKAFRDDPSFEVIDGEAPDALTQSALVAARQALKEKDDALEEANNEVTRLKQEVAAYESASGENALKIKELTTKVENLEAENKTLKDAAEKAPKATPKK